MEVYNIKMLNNENKNSQKLVIEMRFDKIKENLNYP